MKHTENKTIEVSNKSKCNWCNDSCETCKAGDNCWYCEDREFGDNWQ